MKRALRVTGDLFLLTAQLYREIAVSAMSLIPGRRSSTWRGI
jgi:hypothetical protein